MWKRMGAVVFAGILVPTASAAGEATFPPSLQLRWCDPHGLLQFGWTSVGQELSRIFHAIGVDATLTKDSATTGIRVLLVRSEPDQWGLPANAMGAVLSQSGPQTEIYIFFPSVVRVAGYRPEALSRRWPTQREERALARALARVAAHEIMHAVLPARPHDDKGLTRQTLDRASLLAERFEIDCEASRELRSALLHRSQASTSVQHGSPVDDHGGVRLRHHPD